MKQYNKIIILSRPNTNNDWAGIFVKKIKNNPENTVAMLRRKKVKIVDVIFPVLTIIVGIVLAFGNAISWLVICTGVFLCIDGVIGVIGHFKK